MELVLHYSYNVSSTKWFANTKEHKDIIREKKIYLEWLKHYATVAAWPSSPFP